MQEAKFDEVVPVMLIRGKMSAIVGLSVMICLCPIIFCLVGICQKELNPYL